MQKNIRDFENIRITFDQMKFIKTNSREFQDFSLNLNQHFFNSIKNQISELIDMLERRSSTFQTVATLSTDLFTFLFFVQNPTDIAFYAHAIPQLISIYNRLADKIDNIAVGDISGWMIRYFVVIVALLILVDPQQMAPIPTFRNFVSNEAKRKDIIEKQNLITFFMQDLIYSNSGLVQTNIKRLFSGFKESIALINKAKQTPTRTVIRNPFHPQGVDENPFGMEIDNKIRPEKRQTKEGDTILIDAAEQAFNYSEVIFPSFTKSWSYKPEPEAKSNQFQEDEESDFS